MNQMNIVSYNLLDGGVNDLCMEDGTKELARKNSVLTSQEKWRVPIFFNKVNKGKPLSAQDKRIWNLFVGDKSEEELWAYISLHRSNRDASLPENCPLPTYTGKSLGKLKACGMPSIDTTADSTRELRIEPTQSRTFSFDSRSSRCPSIDHDHSPISSPRQTNLVRRCTTSKLASASDEGAYPTCPGRSADERAASGHPSTRSPSRRHSVGSTSESSAPARPFVPPSLRSLMGWSRRHSLIGSSKVAPTTATEVGVEDM